MSNTPLSEREERLLRQQAEAYAFIKDIRDSAIMTGNRGLVARTEGIDATIEQRSQEFPQFKQYLLAAYERGAQARLESLKNGQGEAAEGRKAPEAPQEKPPRAPKRSTRGTNRATPRPAKKTTKSPRRKKPE